LASFMNVRFIGSVPLEAVMHFAKGRSLA
jgi:hypothetical protein